METGELGVLMVPAQKLVAQDIKGELGRATVRQHQMVANLALVPHLPQPHAKLINVQVSESKNYFLTPITLT